MQLARGIPKTELLQPLDHFAYLPTSMSTFSLLQDENDNPPKFSKPSYVITVMEDIMAGTEHGPAPSSG